MTATTLPDDASSSVAYASPPQPGQKWNATCTAFVTSLRSGRERQVRELVLGAARLDDEQVRRVSYYRPLLSGPGWQAAPTR